MVDLPYWIVAYLPLWEEFFEAGGFELNYSKRASIMRVLSVDGKRSTALMATGVYNDVPML